ncbi:unnamed protein product [Didymodactylos carnosus]|uniref:Uncharacterized protein n=1 Tax=Didymodactylos carnosus TaxID=1234261 RepID=A0A815YH21_9BILA|nr:unnamed protein product [Didymodactylos carnosus]CAF4433957.1 unnamed protein product [Didymodactylos carnosus]
MNLDTEFDDIGETHHKLYDFGRNLRFETSNLDQIKRDLSQVDDLVQSAPKLAAAASRVQVKLYIGVKAAKISSGTMIIYCGTNCRVVGKVICREGIKSNAPASVYNFMQQHLIDLHWAGRILAHAVIGLILG